MALRQSRGEAGSWVVSLTRALQAVLPVTPRMEHDLMLGHYTSKKYHAADATEVREWNTALNVSSQTGSTWCDVNVTW